MQQLHNQSVTSITPKDHFEQVESAKVSKLKCKICHDYELVDNPLKILCACKEKKYKVHQDCLTSYLEEKANKLISIESDWQRSLICDNCQEYYIVQHSTRRVCSSVESIVKNIKRRSFVFGLCIISSIISIIALSVCSVQLGKNTSGYLDNQLRTIVLILLIIFSAFLLMVSIFKIIFSFISILKVKISI